MKQNKPYFSIIIPCLNEEKYLPRLLEDLTEQSFSDFEVLVVDGQSEDQTVNKAKVFEKNLKLKIFSAKKRNVSHQRNLGAKKSQGNYLIFFDADNQLPHFFLEGVKYNLTKKSVDCFTTYLHPDTSNPGDLAIMNFSNLAISASMMAGKPTAFGAMIGCTPAAFATVGGFDESIKFQEDEAFVRAMAKMGQSVTVFSDPYLIFSFRRFRKEGNLKIMRNFATLQLAKFISTDKLDEKLYPMVGGKYYDETGRRRMFDLKSMSSSFSHLTKQQAKKLRLLFKSKEDEN